MLFFQSDNDPKDKQPCTVSSIRKCLWITLSAGMRNELSVMDNDMHPMAPKTLLHTALVMIGFLATVQGFHLHVFSFESTTNVEQTAGAILQEWM